MTIEAQKIELTKQILEINDKALLDQLSELVARNDEVRVYTVKGESLSEESLRKEVLLAEEQMKRGEYVSHENVKKEIAKW